VTKNAPIKCQNSEWDLPSYFSDLCAECRLTAKEAFIQIHACNRVGKRVFKVKLPEHSDSPEYIHVCGVHAKAYERAGWTEVDERATEAMKYLTARGYKITRESE